MCKFESLQNNESRAQSAGSLKPQRKPRAFFYALKSAEFSDSKVEMERSINKTEEESIIFMNTQTFFIPECEQVTKYFFVIIIKR